MKILHFISSVYGPGGTENRLVTLLKGLESVRHIRNELVVMSKDIHYDEVKDLNIKIHFLIRKIKKDPTIFFKFYQVCKEFRPDIIHTWSPMTSFYAMPVSKFLWIKFINGMITHAPSKLKVFRKFWFHSKLTFPFSDAILSNSYAGLKSFNVQNKKNSYCIHNGFDFSRLKNLKSKEKIREKFNMKDEKVVGMVANFTDNKDYKTYLLAAEKVLEKRNDITFVAVGDGKNIEEFKQYIRSKYKSKIKFLGKQMDVESIVNIFNVGVLLTNQKVHGEGISNSIMEYMALGKPVIATDGGGTKEIVVNNKTGFLIGDSQVDELVDRIEYLLENDEISKSMGKAGNEIIAAEFSLNRMIDNFVKLYESILSKNQKIAYENRTS